MKRQSQLDQLRDFTTVVADTGDIESIARYRPQDVTTNPSLLLKAAQEPKYQHLVREAIAWARDESSSDRVAATMDRLAVVFGVELSALVPGRVSTEVDAALSFDTKGSVDKAKVLLDLYRQRGLDESRVLIKIASTWEGIKAAEILEKEGINCNLTLLFGFAQAVACAEARVFLISPFVGRILDWHQKNENRSIPIEDDPGVRSVTEIYNYYKHFEYETVVMGASFRSVDQVLSLAGCDRLTIGPDLLSELDSVDGQVERRLRPDQTEALKLEKTTMTEGQFRWLMNEDAMATEKLAEGIRGFHSDYMKLKQLVTELQP